MGERSTNVEPRTRLVLLGTGGGPVIDKNQTRMGPCNLVVVDGVHYVIDAGEGAPRQLLRAGVSTRDVDHVFITHQHFDHNSDLGNLLAYAWFSGRRRPIDVWGPTRLEGMVADYMSTNQFDFRLREQETGRPPFDPIPRVHELDLTGAIQERDVEVMSDPCVTVSAIKVNHGLVPSVSYRFRTPDRDIVFSGDRGGQDDIAKFAEGADTLVHEVLHYEAMLKTYPNASKAVLKHYREDHTSPEDVGRIATEAGIRTLVLNHILPDNDLVQPEEWIRLAGQTFDGEIILGADLLEV